MSNRVDQEIPDLDIIQSRHHRQWRGIERGLHLNAPEVDPGHLFDPEEVEGALVGPVVPPVDQMP